MPLLQHFECHMGLAAPRFVSSLDEQKADLDLRLSMMLHAPAASLEEQALSRNPEHARGFLDAAVGTIERTPDHRLLEDLHGGGERLVDPDANLRIDGGDRRNRPARRLNLW